jgi:hypothetical protein
MTFKIYSILPISLSFAHHLCAHHLWLLVNPVELAGLVLNHITLGEPESNLLFGILYTIAAVADISTNVNGKVTTDSTWSRC